MRWRQSFRVAVDAMSAHRTRTLLSTLGVVVGVGALVAIFALSDGLERFTREQIAQTTDLQMIVVQPATSEVVDGVRIERRHPVRLGPADASDLAARVADRADVAIATRSSEWLRFDGDTAAIAALVSRTTPDAAALLPAPLAAGRFLRSADSLAAVGVASASLAKLGRREVGDPLGRSVETPWGRVEIVGVLAADSSRDERELIVPFAFGADDGPPAAIAVRVRRVEEIGAVRDVVEEWAGDRFDGDPASGTGDVSVRSRQARAAQVRRGMLMFKLIMGAIAGISLVVGGIGIMNVLLASVSERTREIGIRKAAGARQMDIRLQFVAEAVAISGLGSLLGLGLGMAGAVLIASAARRLTEAPVSAAFTWPSLLFAAGAAILVGLVFGIWPAVRAGRLSPIEALREE
ncbi:MAG: ABC transporter permease [Gemmatimonadales bacterium]|jgi:putative ABC transport system permease protein